MRASTRRTTFTCLIAGWLGAIVPIACLAQTSDAAPPSTYYLEAFVNGRETGLVVQVPPFINIGDRIRVNTETGEYQSRV